MKKPTPNHQVSLDDIFKPIREYRDKIHRLYLDSISSTKK